LFDEFSHFSFIHVNHVCFSIFSSESVLVFWQRSLSVVNISSSTLLNHTGLPKDGGLLDLRMGSTTVQNLKCRTCECDALHCPGHFGRIELAKPVFHTGFLPFLLKVLRYVLQYRYFQFMIFEHSVWADFEIFVAIFFVQLRVLSLLTAAHISPKSRISNRHDHTRPSIAFIDVCQTLRGSSAHLLTLC
jgi:hypothetical protein